VREAHVYCEIHPWQVDDAFVRTFRPAGIILSGGPASAAAPGAPRAAEAVFALGVSVLGICYGLQVMAVQLGGAVGGGGSGEFGYARVRVLPGAALLGGLADAEEGGAPVLDVWMSHGDQVTDLPNGFTCIATSDGALVAAMADPARRFYGVQFHPEVTHTPQGRAILERFLFEECRVPATWTPRAIARDLTARVRETVGDARVLLGLSGGVDSSVLAVLLHRAIGDRLACVFVDSGLLREREGDTLMEVFAGKLGIPVHRANARAEFFAALAGIEDPEAKRKAVGRTFIEVFEAHARTLGDIRFLAQGTIYPDVIESAGASGAAQVIKSHHNVGGLPERMHLKLLEPLRELFKDEVRALGRELGLDESIVGRHPFPGPGLAVRVLGEVTEAACETLRRADAIYIEELRAQGLYDAVAQAFAVYLPVRSVGVTGDGRRYEPVIALRAVETTDFMTANPARLPHAFLEHVARRIINEVPGISRVTYDISGKPPATIEWE
jgi:GMP synthase (glutamine-hydrolysing)